VRQQHFIIGNLQTRNTNTQTHVADPDPDSIDSIGSADLDPGRPKFEKTYVKVFDPKKFQIIIFLKLFCQQKIYPDPDAAKYLNTNP
jgi:hypothetical protein